MALIRPRLNDHYELAFTQEEVDFAIPFLDDDIPLYVDPFLLWKSPSQQDQALHTALVSSFNHFGYLSKTGKQQQAVEALIRMMVSVFESKQRLPIEVLKRAFVDFSRACPS
jgi:hypothetical protein